MKQSVFTLEQSRRLTADVWEWTLSGDTSALTAPGQFVNLAVSGKFLRRPISVCDWNADRLVLLIRQAGDGTRELLKYQPGAKLDILSGLGNGFSLDRLSNDSMERAILVGGGIGIAPLYGLARMIRQHGFTPVTALGFQSAADMFYREEFAALGAEIMTATEDGSAGIRGRVTDLPRTRPERTYVFCCGPLPMLKAVHALEHLTGGQFSFEARMGCGFGACMGCSIPTKTGYRRVCREGPVFMRDEIVWPN